MLLQRGLALISRGKCGPPLIKVTLTELSVSNFYYVFDSESRWATQNGVRILSRYLRDIYALRNIKNI